LVYSINGTASERVDEIKDLGVIMDGSMPLSPNCRECWVLLSGDFQLFQKDQDRLDEWSRGNKFDLNAGKCKSISFRRNMWINGTTNERVDEIKDLRVIMGGRMSRILGFIKRIPREFHDPYTQKTLYTSLVSVWSPQQSVHSEWLKRVQHNFIRYTVLPWRVWPLPAYDARCL
jgi:hypothetical protein